MSRPKPWPMGKEDGEPRVERTVSSRHRQGPPLAPGDEEDTSREGDCAVVGPLVRHAKKHANLCEGALDALFIHARGAVMTTAAM